jgi:hypothetical protein
VFGRNRLRKVVRIFQGASEDDGRGWVEGREVRGGQMDGDGIEMWVMWGGLDVGPCSAARSMSGPESVDHG